MYSYISVLSTNNYLPGALVVNKCLELTKVIYPFHVLITENITEQTKNILKSNNINIIQIDSIFLQNHKIDKWYYTFSKLNIFNQTQFSKIIYIDLDMVITENLDHLFDKKHLSSVNSGGFIYKNWTALNSGLMVIEPSTDMFNDLQNLLNNGDYSGDQNILHKYYPNWSKNRDLNLGY